MRKSPVLMLACCTMFFVHGEAALSWDEAGSVGQPMRIKFARFDSVYVKGDRIPITYTLHNETTSEQPLILDYYGLVWGLSVTVSDSSGRELVPRRVPGGPGAVGGSDSPLLAPDDSVELGFDLTEVFDLPQPGRYHLTASFLTFKKEVVGEWDIEILALAEKTTVDVRGGVSGLGEYPRILNGGVEVTCRIETAKALNRDAPPLTVITAKILSQEGMRLPFWMTSVRFKISRAAKVKTAKLDYKWQLWTVLESSGQESLLVWDLLHNRVRSVGQWTDKPIVLGATAATPLYPDAKVVIAGRAGSTKLSTTILSWDE